MTGLEGLDDADSRIILVTVVNHDECKNFRNWIRNGLSSYFFCSEIFTKCSALARDWANFPRPKVTFWLCGVVVWLVVVVVDDFNSSICSEEAI